VWATMAFGRAATHGIHEAKARSLTPTKTPEHHAWKEKTRGEEQEEEQEEEEEEDRGDTER
jgi:hypothetical protein